MLELGKIFVPSPDPQHRIHGNVKSASCTSDNEARQDFDSKLTPVRYEDIRYTQGES